MKKTALTALAIGAALLAASPARAQDGGRDLVAALLESSVALMAAENHTPSHDPVMGELAAAADETFEIEVEAGKTYFMLGVCDENCSDLDLILKDGRGAVLASDVETDDSPVITFQATRNATLVLEVDMATCSVDECWFGARVFENSGQ